MKPVDCILLAAVILLIAGAVRILRRNRKSGCGRSCCGCPGCRRE